jgi:hypothetical protein
MLKSSSIPLWLPQKLLQHQQQLVPGPLHPCWCASLAAAATATAAFPVPGCLVAAQGQPDTVCPAVQAAISYVDWLSSAKQSYTQKDDPGSRRDSRSRHVRSVYRHVQLRSLDNDTATSSIGKQCRSVSPGCLFSSRS